jgi:hypothetical protein
MRRAVRRHRCDSRAACGGGLMALLTADFDRIIGRIWDPKIGGFERKYYTDGRLVAIYGMFRDDTQDLFANVVELLIRKFRTTPTVEQFREVGDELRAKRRERTVQEEKQEYKKAAEIAQVSFRAYVQSVVSDRSRREEFEDLVAFHGLARLERVLGEKVSVAS